jgi:hypothetical protein
MFVIALLVHLTLVWAAAEWLVARLTPGPKVRRDDATTALTGMLVVVLSVANIPMYAQQHGPTDDAHTMPALRRMFEPLEALRDHQPVLYRTDNLRLYEPYSSTVQLQLRDRGIEFRVDDEGPVRQLGNGRRADGSEPATLAQFEAWQVVGGDLPGCVLVRASSLEPDADAAFERNAAELADRIAASGFDVSGVLAAARADDADRDLATRFATGETSAIREVTYDGRLRFWIEGGWSNGPAEIVAELEARGPAITEWLNSVVALVVTPDDVCGDSDRTSPSVSPGASTRG